MNTLDACIRDVGGQFIFVDGAIAIAAPHLVF